MDYVDLAIAVFATVILFIYGLQSFSREVRTLGEERLSQTLQKLTHNRIYGFLLGAGFTAVVQSSSAVTALAVVLVDAGAMTFVGSLAVLIGSNVGTTVTAWLVSVKLTEIGPVFIVLGAVLGAVPGRLRVSGKSVFYFGFIFFALDLISESLTPVAEDPQLTALLAEVNTPIIGALVGAALTALLQSSSVVTGLSIILVQQGAMDPTSAVAIVIGANAGSTATALIASISTGSAAKRTALANIVINVCGVLLFLPFVSQLSGFVTATSNDPGIAVALAHLIFNVIVAALALPLVGPLARLLAPRGTTTGANAR